MSTVRASSRSERTPERDNEHHDISSKHSLTTGNLPAHSWTCTFVDTLRTNRQTFKDLQAWIQANQDRSISASEYEYRLQCCPASVGFNYLQEWEAHVATCACQHLYGDFTIWGNSLMVLINRTTQEYRKDLGAITVPRWSNAASSAATATTDTSDVHSDMFSVDNLGDL